VRVLVASDGGLSAERAAEFAARLAGPEGSVRVVTAVEVPRSVLDSLRAAYEEYERTEPIDTDAEYVSASAPRERTSGWPGDDLFINRYVQDQTETRLAGIRQELERRGVIPETVGIESEDPTTAVLDQLQACDAEVLVVGSHGRGRFDGLLGSVGTKLVRRSPVPVLVCR
jgi:nucleotide-binding universal stress UspA family protein